MYINDIGDNLNDSSQLKLFADDGLAIRTINNNTDHDILQHDLDSLVSWAEKWQMCFNPDKCFVLRVTRKRRVNRTPYIMMGKVLQDVDSTKYLGVELTSKLTWNAHISSKISKANSVLGFLRRNLTQCPQSVKEQAYFTLVRPHVEYACTAWDPHQQYLKDQLEMVQRRAARFVTKNYSREPGTVTELLSNLGWPSLETRRKVMRLSLFYKALAGDAEISMPKDLQGTTRNTRQHHSRRFTRPSTSTNQYANSFFANTIRDWNSLPPDTLEAPSIETFKVSLWKHLQD